jgi:hypothetical protein
MSALRRAAWGVRVPALEQGSGLGCWVLESPSQPGDVEMGSDQGLGWRRDIAEPGGKDPVIGAGRAVPLLRLPGARLSAGARKPRPTSPLQGRTERGRAPATQPPQSLARGPSTKHDDASTKPKACVCPCGRSLKCPPPSTPTQRTPHLHHSSFLGKDATVVDSDWFLCPLKILDHEGPFMAAFPVENR